MLTVNPNLSSSLDLPVINKNANYQTIYPSFDGYLYSGSANPNWDYTQSIMNPTTGTRPATAQECADIVISMSTPTDQNDFAVFNDRAGDACWLAHCDYTTGNGGNSLGIKQIFDSNMHISSMPPINTVFSIPGSTVTGWKIWDGAAFKTMDLRSAYSSSGGEGGSQGDPHIHFAHGGVADLRGKNNTYVSLLSVPGFQFSAKTMDTDFLLPRPQLVHGSFFTDVGFRFRGRSGREYGVTSSASKTAFDVFDVKSGSLIHAFSGIWKQWWEDGVRVYYKHTTIYIRAHGWEVNATRHPIYNYVSGPSTWRFDFALRYLDGTGFENLHGKQSETCFPHGIIGQSWDGDKLAVDGKLDNYTYSRSYPVVTTSANAEGSIEGTLNDYLLKGPWDVDTFKFSRYDKSASDVCKPRDVNALKGKKHFVASSSVATTTDLVDDS